MNIHYLRPVMMLALFFALAQAADPDFRLKIEQTRPLILLVTVLVLANLLKPTLQGWQIWRKDQARSTWQQSLQTLGWLLPSLNLGTILLILALGDSPSEFEWFKAENAVMVSVSLWAGLHMALAFSPADEPNLETALSYPRPLAWLLLERFAGVLLLHSAVAGVGMVLSATYSLAWLPSLIFMAGVGAYITLSSRVMAFGMMLVVIIGVIFLQFQALFTPNALPLFAPLNYLQPFLWGINPYLEGVSGADYLLNRGLVLLLGFQLLQRAVGQLHDTETLLMSAKTN